MKNILIVIFFLFAFGQIRSQTEDVKLTRISESLLNTSVKSGVCMDLASAKTEDVDSLIKLMADAGVDYIRLNFRWAYIETLKGNFNWTIHDRLVDKLIANNIAIDGLFGVVPSWANGMTAQNTPVGYNSTSYPPTNVQDFYDFVKVTVERYKTRIRYWTMRNEPNLASYWAPAPNIEEYTLNLKAGYEAVKAVDPDIKVIGGTIGGNGVFMGWESPESRYFLQKMCDSKATDYCDIISIHPYNDPVKGIDALQARIDEAINVLKINGINKPVWVDEIGWSTLRMDGTPLATEDEVAAWLTKVFTELKNVDRILWYNFKDAIYDPQNKEHHFGVVDYNLQPKKAYYALKQLNGIYSDTVVNGITSATWIKSLNIGNFNSIGTDSRCMTYANDKLYFGDRDGTTTTYPGSAKKIQVYNATTGDFIKTVTLPSINDAYGNNSIRTDAAGNLILTNMTTDARTATGTPFNVWKMADEDATPTLIINYTDPTASKAVRIDFGSIYGDVNGDGYILASISKSGTVVDDQDKTILKWTINSGVVSSTPEKIILQSYSPATVTSNGSYAQIYPVNASQFYVDGATTYPTLYNTNGTIADGFSNAPAGITKPITNANGVATVKLGTTDFLICGANTETTLATKNCFYLYQMGDGGTFTGMTLLDTLPVAGLGSAINTYSVVLPVVEKINETKANIYLYANKNGFAKYELTINSSITDVNKIKIDDNYISIKNGKIIFSEISNVDVYNSLGQKLFSRQKVHSIDAPIYKGIYIIKFVNQKGLSKSKKILTN